MSLFVTSSSRVDKEALQEYVLKKLNELMYKAEYLIGDDSKDFWQKIHIQIVKIKDDEEKRKLLKVEEQLRKLPQYIDTWVKTAVDSTERFDFFIMTKAKEISSGDKNKDYFWAMQIRHDQMVALVRVLTKLLQHMEMLIERSPKEVLKDPVIVGLMDYSVEDQVYLEAEKVHSEREKLAK